MTDTTTTPRTLDLGAKIDSTPDALDVEVIHEASGLRASIHVPMTDESDAAVQEVIDDFMSNLPLIFERAIDASIQRIESEEQA